MAAGWGHPVRADGSEIPTTPQPVTPAPAPAPAPAAPPPTNPSTYGPIVPYETGPTAGAGGAIAVTNAQIATHPNLLNASQQQIIDYINTNYSPGQAHLLQIPELRDAMVEGVRNGDTSEQMQMRIERTTWWQQRTESARQMDLLQATDPVEYQHQVDAKMATIIPKWAEYGANDGDMQQLAKDSLRLGFTDAQLNNLMVAHLAQRQVNYGLTPGTKGSADAQELLRIARQEYLTPMPQETAEQWVLKGLASGTDITGEWRQYLSHVAGERYGITPTSGVTPADLMAPIRAQIGSDLEVNPNSIDLLDPAYSAVLQQPTADGHYRTMTTSEAGQWARSQPGYKGTKGAADAAASLATTIRSTFGLNN